jgi:hypothetical protein
MGCPIWSEIFTIKLTKFEIELLSERQTCTTALLRYFDAFLLLPVVESALKNANETVFY